MHGWNSQGHLFFPTSLADWNCKLTKILNGQSHVQTAWLIITSTISSQLAGSLVYRTCPCMLYTNLSMATFTNHACSDSFQGFCWRETVNLLHIIFTKFIVTIHKEVFVKLVGSGVSTLILYSVYYSKPHVLLQETFSYNSVSRIGKNHRK